MQYKPLFRACSKLSKNASHYYVSISYSKNTNLNTPKNYAFFNVMPFHFKFVKFVKFLFEICVL